MSNYTNDHGGLKVMSVEGHKSSQHLVKSSQMKLPVQMLHSVSPCPLLKTLHTVKYTMTEGADVSLMLKVPTVM